MKVLENFKGKPLRKSQGVVMDGQRKTLGEWAKFYNISYSIVYTKLKKGWDMRKAITSPAQKPGKNMIGICPKSGGRKKKEYQVSTTILDARNSLPEELRTVFDELLDAYKYHASMLYKSRMYPPKIVAALVVDGWRLTERKEI